MRAADSVVKQTHSIDCSERARCDQTWSLNGDTTAQIYLILIERFENLGNVLNSAATIYHFGQTQEREY